MRIHTVRHTRNTEPAVRRPHHRRRGRRPSTKSAVAEGMVPRLWLSTITAAPGSTTRAGVLEDTLEWLDNLAPPS